MKTKKLVEIDDNTDENSGQNIKLDFNDDYRYFGRSSFGILIQDKYCKCGRVRSVYEEKLSSPRCDNIYEMGKMANDVFELDKGAIYLTKKSLMLNQFLEYNDTTKSTVHVNDNTVNRFGLNVSKKKCHLKNATFDVQVVENKTTQTLCVPSSVFSDKRLVSLFRSVALYWFFCLNTVLAKGEVFKRKTLTAFELQRNNPMLLSSSNLELQISPDLLENFNDLNNDFLWSVILNEKSRNANSLLSYAEHSREKLMNDLFKKVLMNMADNTGIFRNMSDMVRSNALQRNSSNERHTKKSTSKARNKKYVYDLHDLGSYGDRMVWKNRVVKNKSKTLRRPQVCIRTGRSQVFNAQCGLKFGYVDDDLQEETVTAYEEPNIRKEFDNRSSPILKDIYDDFVSGPQERDLKLPEENESTKYAELETASSDATTSTSKSLESEEDSYFLPEGMLNTEEKCYPEYHLWCSPLIAEQVIPKKKPKRVPSPKVEPSMPTFKPYRLWESSFAAEEDHIPNFRNQQYFSVFSMPYYPHETVRQTRQEPSMYNLWGSPNIIDFLPGCVRLSDNEYSSRSSSSSDSMEFDPNETFEVLKARRQENHFVRGKFLNFKPVTNGFVSFTDRGAFKYYKKPEQKEHSHVTKPKIKDLTLDPIDTEVRNVTVTTPPQQNDTELSIYFKPIQPAFKVDTDMPANIERSESGTFYYNKHKLMTFKHETDSIIPPHDLFQPKFIVSHNDVACQTERFGCSSRMSFSSICNEPLPVSPFYEAENKDQEQYISGAAFFYSLEEVFNFLGKPGLGNIDVKAHVDYSCMF